MPASSNKSAVTQKRAGTEACPYTELFDIHQLDSTTGTEKTWQRAAGWNVERVVREPEGVPAIK